MIELFIFASFLITDFLPLVKHAHLNDQNNPFAARPERALLSHR